jgi:anti-sigma factor RsiW
VTDAHVVDELAACALESLDAAERARVEAHVASCASCGRQLREHRAVAGALPFALPPVTPPAEALPSILAAARARRPRRAHRVMGALRWPAVAALVTSLLLWNVGLQRELARRSPGPAPGPEVEALSRRPRARVSSWPWMAAGISRSADCRDCRAGARISCGSFATGRRRRRA